MGQWSHSPVILATVFMAEIIDNITGYILTLSIVKASVLAGGKFT